MFTEGTFWSEQRRFSLRHLRDFGFGKQSTENVIWEEAEDLAEKVLRKNEIVEVKIVMVASFFFLVITCHYSVPL